jgi:nicotinate-nucleotide adenylyltransferase
VTRSTGRLLPLPPHGPGQRIGLFGGSFDPPHAGHAHVVRTALARLALDRVWVLVTPGNPLKRGGPAPVAERMRRLRELISHPRVMVTDFEARAGLRYSRDLVDQLVRRAPGVRFVWIMGADNLAGFHRWQDWERIAASLPIAVIDRPGASFAPLSSPAATALAAARLPEAEAPRLADMPAPAWVFLHAQRLALSSTALRAGRGSVRARPAVAGTKTDAYL